MFLSHKILEETMKDAMIKYGIRSIDPEVLFMISDAMKVKYT
jgi:hypothetical protein